MQSLDIVCKIEYRKFEGEALCNLGKVYADQGDSNEAIDYFDQALEIFQKMEYRRGESDARFNKSLALDKLGQRQNAIENAKAALQIFEQIESPRAEKVRLKLAEWQGSSHQEN
jgi:tetratricopeptide (TPR) repeat protein